jgi:hypothetical protein
VAPSFFAASWAVKFSELNSVDAIFVLSWFERPSEHRRQPSDRFVRSVGAGIMAQRFGVARSITWGGLVCVGGVVASIGVLPAFWRYRREEVTDTH